MRLGEARLTLDGPLEERGRLLEGGALVMHDAEIVQEAGIVGRERKRPAAEGERLLEPAGEPVGLGKIGLKLRHAAIGRSGAGEEIDGGRQIPDRVGDDAVKMERRGMGGRHGEDILAEDLRALGAPAAQMVLSLGQGLVERQAPLV